MERIGSVGEESKRDSCSMDNGGKGRSKEKEKDTRMTESADNVAAVPRQWHQKACWYFVTS